MFARMRTVSVVAGCVLSLSLVGCFSTPWTRTGNQGGSTPATLLMKVATNKLGEFNADDIQVMTDTLTDLAQLDLPAVSDQLAQAVIDVLQANHITSFEDLKRKVEAAAADPNQLVVPPGIEDNLPEVRQLLETLSDPAIQQKLHDRLIQLGEQFGII